MAFTVVLFAYRKPGMTPAAFRAHYENIHVPLMKELGGNLFPVSHTRRYISQLQVDSEDEAQRYLPEVMSSSPSDLSYDAITEMSFDSKDAFLKFSELLAEPHIAPKVAEDCAAFLDVSRVPLVVVIGEMCETRRDSSGTGGSTA
ncbi:EthD domain-containing protein [Fusarium sp. LHS14.1]|nr:EthD domain-containing protein [Fusarium sp. LHS14.1]